MNINMDAELKEAMQVLMEDLRRLEGTPITENLIHTVRAISRQHFYHMESMGILQLGQDWSKSGASLTTPFWRETGFEDCCTLFYPAYGGKEHMVKLRLDGQSHSLSLDIYPVFGPWPDQKLEGTSWRITQ